MGGKDGDNFKVLPIHIRVVIVRESIKCLWLGCSLRELTKLGMYESKGEYLEMGITHISVCKCG